MAMAFTHKMSSTKLSLIVVFVAFMSSKADLVDVVCDSESGSDICKKSLRSDPNWETADMYDLGLIAIGVAQNRTKDIYDLLENLKPDIYSSCMKNYQSARREILNSIIEFHQEKYDLVDQRGAAANNASTACDAIFGSDPQAPPEPPALVSTGAELRILYSTVSNIAQKLHKRSIAPREGLIDNICNQTQLDPGFCKTALSSDLRSRDADIWTLAEIGINSAQSYANSTISLLQSLQQNATGPDPKKDYDDCLRNYATVNDELIKCLTALRELDYKTMNERAQAAYFASDMCYNEFRKPQASEKEDLKTAAFHIKTLCYLVSYISTI